MEGILKNRMVTMIMVSVFFSLMHMPFHGMWYEGTVGDYFTTSLGYHLTLCFLHIVFQYLYDRYRHVAAPTIFHFVYDFIQWLMIGTN